MFQLLPTAIYFDNPERGYISLFEIIGIVALLLMYNLLNCFIQYVKVGVTTEDIDKVVHQAAISFGAYPSPLNYKGFPKSVCTSVNNVAVHGIPDR